MHQEYDGQEGIIQSITYEKKKYKQYNIYIDILAEPLQIHEDILIKFRLLKGTCLTREEIADIKEENGKYMSYISAIRYLASKPRTCKQVEQYLKQKEYSDHQIQSALQRLSEENLINDEHYAFALVESNNRTRKKGRNLLIQYMKELGIKSSIIERAIIEIDEDEEIEAATILAMKKGKHATGDEKTRYRKIYQFLARKGYSNDTIRKAMKSIENERNIHFNTGNSGDMLDN